MMRTCHKHEKKCLIVAEVGINHNGEMNMALECIRAAKQAGADAVKFQNYHTEDFLSDRTLQYTYCSQGREVTESQFDMFKRCELSDAQVHMLAKACKHEGLLFFSTPTGEDGVQVLCEAGAAYLKNGSDYLTHLPLIRAMARSGIPTILSTGMATLAEIDDAVRAFREAGGKDITLLHCTSSYPTPPEAVHLRKIQALRAAFGYPVGLSDHTDGIVAAVGAVGMDACMVEKHFTLDKNLPGPDHRFSMDPDELAMLVSAVRTLELQLGQDALGSTQIEEVSRKQYRLSCVAAKDLDAAHTLTEEDIAFRRPGTGLAPKFAKFLVGRQLNKAFKVGDIFIEEDFL